MFIRFLQTIFFAVVVIFLLMFVLNLCVKDYGRAMECAIGCSTFAGMFWMALTDRDTSGTL